MFRSKPARLIILSTIACVCAFNRVAADDNSNGEYIDPIGIRGTLLQSNAERASSEFLQQLARSVKANSRVVVLTRQAKSAGTAAIRAALEQEAGRRDLFARLARSRAVASRLGWQLRRPPAPALPEPWPGITHSSTTTVFGPPHPIRPPQVEEVVVTDPALSNQQLAKRIEGAGAVCLLDQGSPQQWAVVSQAVRTVLNADGVVAATWNSSLLVRKLPNFVPATGPQEVTKFSVRLQVHHKSTLLVRGRQMRLIGDGQVDLFLAASERRPKRTISLTPDRPVADLVSLQRAARHRAGDDFPPAKLEAPIVKSGTLIIIGGGRTPRGLMQEFVKLAGGKSGRIVILPTAVPDPVPSQKRFAEFLKAAGAGHVDVLVQRTKQDVESDEFLSVLRKATGVFFGGGRQWRFVDAYAGTKAEPLLHDVLKRGGVIAGSSAGASIQAEFLARGNPLGNREIMVEGYEKGLGFLPGVAVDQHFTQRKRQADMTRLIAKYPQFLGIGIDEGTAIVVRQGIARVVGNDQVCFYDSAMEPTDGKDYVSAFQGGEYDLVKRKLIKVGQRRESAKPKAK